MEWLSRACRGKFIRLALTPQANEFAPTVLRFEVRRSLWLPFCFLPPLHCHRHRQPILCHAQVGAADSLYEAREGTVGDADQAQVAIFPIKQAAGHGLVEVLEPVDA